MEARAPLARISRASRTGAAAASTWKVTEPAPASTYWGAHRSGSSIIRWQSSGVSVARARDSTTGTPRVRFGTKWLSMTSTWSQSAPFDRLRLLGEAGEVGGQDAGVDLHGHAPSLPCPGRGCCTGPIRIAVGCTPRTVPGRARPRGAAARSHGPAPLAGRHAWARTGRPAPGVPCDEASRGVAHLVCGRRTKWVVLVLWLVVLFARGAPRPEAHRRPGQRRGLLAARLRRVHPSPRDLRGLQAGADPGGRRVRPRERPHRAGPGADHRGRGPAQGADATTASAAPRPGARSSTGRPIRGRPRSSYRSRWTRRAGSGSRPPSTRSGTSIGEGGGRARRAHHGPGRYLGGLLRGLRGHRLDAAVLGDGRRHRDAAAHLPQPDPAPGPAARR